jgi:penicillin-binding protein 2
MLAEGNRLRTEQIAAPRGLFYDRNGIALVQNIPSFSVDLRMADLPRKDPDRATSINQIADILSMDRVALATQVSNSKDKESITLLDRLNRDQALSYELKLQGIKGVSLTITPIRQYSSVPSLGPILGYIGKLNEEEANQRPDLLPTSYIGKAGLEKTYDQYLQGQSGIDTVEVDSLNRVVRSVGSTPALVGQSVILGIDAKLQELAATALMESINKAQAKSGAVVVMDPQSGEIRAMVSIPSYDNNIFSFSSLSDERQKVLTDPLSPLLNRAIAGQYPSGSTIKPFVAAAALQEKVITSSTKIDTSAGKIVVGQWTFPDWKVHGTADVKQAIAESNNIFFYTMGGGNGNIGGLGADRLDKYLNKFGFGEKTGIDLPGEAAGLVPTPDWKKKVKKESWYIGDTYNLAIGQGDLLVTPLQMARATAAIANGGKLMKPMLVHSVLGNGSTNDTVLSSQIMVNQVADADVIETVRQGMRQTVLTGSAKSLNTLPVETAAKTGTAQYNDLAKDKTHSWFTAFAPYDKPEIAIAVIVEGGGEGYLVAEPVAKNIIEKYFNLPLTPINPQPAN